MRSEFKRRRDFAVTALRDIGMEVRTPQGAFYIFPRVKDEHEFVETLRKRRIIVTPGSTFGSLGKNHVRISYALRFEKLKRAFEIVKEVICA
ncbi:MAG: aminotransferase class I/II-fold pyridoxal phosphate-dependent enzyme [archaeon]|nr:aminotransferase class I/II-fold pyridoxal phosphate-dependent enzyme [archaeon]